MEQILRAIQLIQLAAGIILIIDLHADGEIDIMYSHTIDLEELVQKIRGKKK